MAMPRVLLLQAAEEPGADTLVEALVGHRYDVTPCRDGREVEELLERGAADLLLLDQDAPGVKAMHLLGRVRDRGDAPVILLGARGGELDRVMALELGADDVLAKPCAPREVVARVAAVLRRSRPARDVLELDRPARSVRVNGSALRLSPREYELLACLDARRGQVVTREELLEQVWGTDDAKALASVTEHVRRVRLAIEDDPRNPRWLRTVRPSGYVLEH